MKKVFLFLSVVALSAFEGAIAQTSSSGGASTPSPGGAASTLWQVGRPDDGISEFAPLPGWTHQFDNDGVFVVGRSSAATWPAVQPGPEDDWAGNRSHTYSIVFGIRKPVSEGTCRLDVRLIDVGPRDVALTVSVNGHPYRVTLPEGAGRAIAGDISRGKRYAFGVDIPASDLEAGDNRIDLVTESGSWFIYDWIGFSGPAGLSLAGVKPSVMVTSAKGLPFLTGQGQGGPSQPVRLSLLNTGGAQMAIVHLPGLPDQPVSIKPGNHEVEVLVPAVSADSTVAINLEQRGRALASTKVLLHPVRKMTIYILPHSHNDIGYTEIQTNVERKQMNNLLTGIEYARQTKDYPAGARFVWNLEGMYAADLFLHRMNPAQQQSFIEAVRNGSVGLNGMYVNTLTGLCRPEELLQLFHYSDELAAKCGTTMQSAMISDVPGYTWGTVTAMAQAGIRYFSAAPNYFDRIGDILVQWEDKPFWWVSPSGNEKVLVWIPYKGYALSHGMPHGLSASFVDAYIDELDRKKFPYDISYIRWSGHGDNAVPDRSISDFVKDWSAKYAWPKFIISTTTTAFHAFEERYGDRLPVEKGDWTGYWEDGAGSSALETSENRTTSSRLTQAEALWAMTDPGAFPADSFHQAWKNVILYSEHTWGADESITRPLSQKTMEQWIIKKSYATQADTLSRALVTSAIGRLGADASSGARAGAIDVFNTSSWSRTELVTLSSAQSGAGDLVKDESGRVLPSQRLSTGELAFVATDVPAFASKRYFVSQGSAPAAGAVQADTHSLDNGLLRVEIDTVSGSISSLRAHGIDNEFAGGMLNEYLYLQGNNLADLQRVKGVRISIKESGPVLATLLIRSEAPGCARLEREVRLVNGFDYAEVSNFLDKKPAELNPYPGEYSWANLHGKESLNIGFPFHVQGGQMRLDIPMAQIEPDKNQLPGACRNWLEVGGWADVSNQDFGVTWITLDAPLVEVGGITATMLGGQFNPAIWRKKIEPTQTFYSWALNNHWETNYRAYQEGAIAFRYVLQPHRGFDALRATQRATGFAQPLIAVPAAGGERNKSLLTIGSSSIVVESLRPSVDGKAWMVTLYNPTATTSTATLSWSVPTGAAHLSNTSETVLAPVTGAIDVDGQDVVTVRVERAQ